MYMLGAWHTVKLVACLPPKIHAGHACLSKTIILHDTKQKITQLCLPYIYKFQKHQKKIKINKIKKQKYHKYRRHHTHTTLTYSHQVDTLRCTRLCSCHAHIAGHLGLQDRSISERILESVCVVIIIKNSFDTQGHS
jgi:hypothetical protein